MHTHRTYSVICTLPVALFFCFILTGCGDMETRYDDTVRIYNHDREAGSNVYTSNGAATNRYTIGVDDAATAQYYYKPGYREDTRPVTHGSGYDGSGSGQQQDNMRRLVVLDATDVLFEFDKAVIRPSYYGELDKWVDYFQKNPQVFGDIYGHADSTGPTDYNQGLSEKRAQAIVKYLTDKGVDAHRLTAVGFGETMPIAPNTTKEGRQLNRRVEVNITQ